LDLKLHSSTYCTIFFLTWYLNFCTKLEKGENFGKQNSWNKRHFNLNKSKSMQFKCYWTCLTLLITINNLQYFFYLILIQSSGSDLESVGSTRSSFCLHINHLSFQAFTFLVTPRVEHTFFFWNRPMLVAFGGKVCWSA
jgi:hypothetical protein